jgi:alkylated DNA nucleotide flippase Atl1
MLARVVRGGMVRVGDCVAAVPGRAPAFSDEWQKRVLHVARAVPEGCRIGYRQLAELAGVSTAYCRAFPRVLSSLPEQVARRIGRAGEAANGPSWSGAELFALESRVHGLKLGDAG